MELSSVLTKVRAAITLAEHPNTPTEEAANARAFANKLMLDYAISEAQLDASKPAEQRTKPGDLEMDLCESDNPLGYQMYLLSVEIAAHCRCRSIKLINPYTGKDKIWVGGYESDLRYFEMLFTTIMMHMMHLFFPKVSDEKSMEDNAYELHNLGLNWLDIAELYGWHKVTPETFKWQPSWQGPRPTRADVEGVKVPYWRMERTYEDGIQVGEKLVVEPATMVGSRIKRAYYREIKRRGEEPVKITVAEARKSGTQDFRMNAANGYVSMIAGRLYAARGIETTGNSLVLRSESIDAMIADKFKGNLGQIEKPEVKFNQKAYALGVEHARTADISGGASGVGVADRAGIRAG